MEQHKGDYKVVGTRPIRHDGEDKVTGRALYGGDLHFADLLHGKVLRSPHAHAKVLSVDVSRALALPGVRAVLTHNDLAEQEDKMVQTGEGAENLRFAADRLLAGEKVLFEGHPIVAVAADDQWIASEALDLIEVKYEVLPAVLGTLEAMEPGAPVLHESITITTLGKKEVKASNVVNHIQFKRGELEAGFAQADVVVEREFKTVRVHQGYIEPHTATALCRSDGQVTVWTSTQGAFPAREQTAQAMGVPLSQVKVVPMEIGGGFGGKISVYLEPLVALLSKKSGQPVKMTMSRAEVFEATGPAPATVSRVKLGAKKDGTLTAAEVWLAYGQGAYPGVVAAMGGMCVLAPYKIENLLIDAFDVLTNSTKSQAYRAPSSPQSMFAMESAMDEVAEELGMDPIEIRLKNAVEEGDPTVYGPKYKKIGLKETLEAIKNSEHYKSPLPDGPYVGRGMATGFWFNAGMQSSATVGINMDGTASVVTGSVDIGGSRASMAIMAAEVLGLEAHEVRPSVGDTEAIGHTDVTGGSRTTFATGYAVVEAARDALNQMIPRVAKLWDTQEDKVLFENGKFNHAEDKNKTMTVKELAPSLAKTGGPILGSASVAPKGVGAGFGAHLADVRVDPDTGKTEVLRYTAAQDVGTAIHPAYVEGQIQGGTVQGIGWALNEEYLYDDNGHLLNRGYLDYRMPTMYDLPEIECLIVEVPNPGHPFGVRGVGEVPITPPLPAMRNAISRAIGKRMYELPLNPHKVLKAIRG